MPTDETTLEALAVLYEREAAHAELRNTVPRFARSAAEARLIADALRCKLASLRPFPIQGDHKRLDNVTSIPWSLAEKVYANYAARYGREQSIERMAERGGFGMCELDMFLPDWKALLASLTAPAAQEGESIPIPITVAQVNGAIGIIEEFAPADPKHTDAQVALGDLALWIDSGGQYPRKVGLR